MVSTCVRSTLLLVLLVINTSVYGIDPLLDPKDTNDPARVIERAQALLNAARANQNSYPGQSLLYARNALKLAEFGKDARTTHEALAQLRELHFRSGSQDEFMRYCIRCIELAEELGDARDMGLDLQWLGRAHLMMGDTRHAVESCRRSLYVIQQTEDSLLVAQARTRLIVTLIEAERYDEVMKEGHMAQMAFAALQDTVGEALVWARMGSALVRSDKFADALPLLYTAERMLGDHPDTEDRITLLRDLAEAHFGTGSLGKASELLEQAKELSLRTGKIHLQPSLFALCSKIDEGMGEFSEALECQRMYTQLTDSLFDQRMAVRMAGMQTLYEVNSKERANMQLRDRNTLNEAMIRSERRRNQVLLILTGSLVALLIIMALTTRRYLKALRWIRMKNQVIGEQSEEIHAKNLELERQNLRLAESLISEEEKELLLKEIHHRVKNNLQIVNSLLHMQGISASDEGLNELLEEAQGRIRSMAMVHEHMYRTGDLKQVDVGVYLKVLVEHTMKSLGLKPRVTLELNTASLSFPIDTLVPLSLLINELITNSAKHVFHDTKPGTIRLSMQRLGDRYALRYSDTGPGVEQERFFNGDSFGSQLVRTLAEQLNGTLELRNGTEMETVLNFRSETPRLRVAS